MKTLKTTKILLTFSLASIFFTGCSSYSQEDVDSIKSSYESTIEDLQSQLDSANDQINSLQAQLDELQATPTIPAGMSEDIYSYGVTVLNHTNDYLDGKISLDECHSKCQYFMTDLILADKSSLNTMDEECYNNFLNCYITITNLIEEDFSEYTKEEYEYALPLFRDKLAESLNMK